MRRKSQDLLETVSENSPASKEHTAEDISKAPSQPTSKSSEPSHQRQVRRLSRYF